jgi:DNA polymerase III sliding clamp (beta) subunit (PCNA family)
VGALRLTGVLSGRGGEIKLRPGKSGKAIEVVSSDQTAGRNSYVLPAKIKGEFEETTFNWRYLADGFQTLSCEEVFFGIAKGTRHGFLRDPKDASYFYLLAPLAAYE